MSDPSSGPPPPSSPPVDPYGVDLAIGPSGDLVVNASGSLGAVAGAYNCAQAVFVRLKTTPGELPLHPAYGSSLGAMIGSKLHVGAITQQANADLQAMLADDPRFTSAQVSQAQRPASSNYPEAVMLGVTAQLVGGEALTLDNVTDPSPSDVSLPQIIDPSIDPTLTYDPATEQEFFADTPEFDQLQDTNTLQAIVDDTPNSSILGTTGG